MNASADAFAVGPGSERASILVVDDRPDKLMAFGAVLDQLGQEVVTASSGEEALKRILTQDFAVILLDVNMPGLDGLETAKLIRGRRKSAHTPIIFITADFQDDTHLRNGYALGAVDYIASPVVPEILRAKVRVFVDLFLLARQSERQAAQQLALADERAARVAAERSTQRQTFLARASAMLAGSLDVDATVREIADLVVPQLADVAVLALTPAEHELPRAVQFACAGRGESPIVNRPLGEPIGQALRTAIDEARASGATQRLPLERGGPAVAFPDEHVAHSLLAIPLAVRGRAIAVLALGFTGTRRADPDALALGTDIASRAAVALDNATLYRQIQESDRRKNEFLAMLAHELRNPLAPIANAVQVLKSTGTGGGEVAWARDVIGRQVKQLTRLVDDLLDLSRITQGKIELKLESVNAADIVQAAVETCRPVVDAHRHELTVSLPREPVGIRGDVARMAQLLGNLINNAAKYTEPGGRIDVALAHEGDDAVFRVRDTGMGIPAAALAEIFEPFMQLDRTLDRAQGGLGIGLTLVRRLSELQGGSVSAHSAGPGRGSEFVVKLPAIDAPAAPDSDAAYAAPPAGGVAKSVLVVDDNADVGESTALLLRVAGYDVHLARDGRAALAEADRLTPDAILLDIGLPGMNGYEVAAHLRERRALDRTLIVAVSGYGQDQHQARSRQSGVDYHLVKPIELRAVLSLLAGPRPVHASAASPPAS